MNDAIDVFDNNEDELILSDGTQNADIDNIQNKKCYLCEKLFD